MKADERAAALVSPVGQRVAEEDFDLLKLVVAEEGEPLDLSVGMGKRWEGHTRVADDPDQVRDYRIATKEVKPEDWYFDQDAKRIFIVELNKRGGEDGGLGWISVTKWGKRYTKSSRADDIARDEAHNKYAGEYLQVGTAVVAEELRGQGWGVRLYLRALTLAKSLGFKGVVSLQPTVGKYGPSGRKPGANAVWDWFVEQGMAERHADGYDVLLHTTPQKIAASDSWPMEEEADEQAIHLAVGMGKRWEGHQKEDDQLALDEGAKFDEATDPTALYDTDENGDRSSEWEQGRAALATGMLARLGGTPLEQTAMLRRTYAAFLGLGATEIVHGETEASYEGADPIADSELPGRVLDNLRHFWVGGAHGHTSSGSDTADAAMLAIRRAAAAEFGLTSSMMADEAALSRDGQHYAAIYMQPEVQRVLRAALRATYDETQALLAEHGIERVTVFRGTSTTKMAPALAAVAKQQADNHWSEFAGDGANEQAAVGDGAWVTIERGALTSWTVSPSRASRFAIASPDDYMPHGRGGVLWATTVPRAAILATPRSFMSSGREEEVVLLGGPSRAFAIWSQTPGEYSEQEIARRAADAQVKHLSVGMGKRWAGHTKEDAAPRQPLKYFTPYYEDERPNPAGPHEPAMLPRLGKDGVPVEHVERIAVMESAESPDEGFSMMAGRVPEGEPVLVYRTVPLSTLIRAAKTGDFASRKKFTAAWEGQTQVGIDPGDIAMWHPPPPNQPGSSRFLAQIDIQGLPLRVNPQQFHEDTGTMTGDTGLGIGVEGPIPVSRVLKVWRVAGSWPVVQLHPVKLDVGGPKPTSFELSVGMGKRWEGHAKNSEEGPEPLDEGTLGSLRAAGGEAAVRRVEADRMNVFLRTKETQQTPIPAKLDLAPRHSSPLFIGNDDVLGAGQRGDTKALIGETAELTMRRVTNELEDVARAVGMRGIRIAEVRQMTADEASDSRVAGVYNIYANRITLSDNIIAGLGQYLAGQRTPTGFPMSNTAPETAIYALAHEVLHASDPMFRNFTPANMDHPLAIMMTEALNDTMAKRLVEGALGFPSMHSDYRPLVDNLAEMSVALGRDVAHEAWRQTSVTTRAEVITKAVIDYLDPPRFVSAKANRQVWNEIAPYAAALLGVGAQDPQSQRMMGGLRELKKHLARDENEATAAVAAMVSQLKQSIAAMQASEED